MKNGIENVERILKFIYSIEIRDGSDETDMPSDWNAAETRAAGKSL